MKKLILLLAALAASPLLPFNAMAEDVQDNNIHVVQIDDAGNTRPPNSVATPQQVQTLAQDAAVARVTAATALTVATRTAESIAKYSTNYVVSSTVYVRSIGAIPYDSSNQHIVITSIDVDNTPVLPKYPNGILRIVGVLKQTPLQDPKLDWRISLTDGNFATITSDVAATALPAGHEGKAYLFTLSKPTTSSAFFRVVDNSTGASGSGNYWLVFNGICVNGQMGLTTEVEGHTFVGGVLVEPLNSLAP